MRITLDYRKFPFPQMKSKWRVRVCTLLCTSLAFGLSWKAKLLGEPVLLLSFCSSWELYYDQAWIATQSKAYSQGGLKKLSYWTFPMILSGSSLLCDVLLSRCSRMGSGLLAWMWRFWLLSPPPTHTALWSLRGKISFQRQHISAKQILFCIRWLNSSKGCEISSMIVT